MSVSPTHLNHICAAICFCRANNVVHDNKLTGHSVTAGLESLMRLIAFFRPVVMFALLSVALPCSALFFLAKMFPSQLAYGLSSLCYFLPLILS
jgi:hypothetical protein